MTVVFLCVGAAKAGTDWLHRQLMSHPDCHLRIMKELHYFDAIDAGRLNARLKYHAEQQKLMLESVAGTNIAPSNTQAQWLTDRAEWLDVLEIGQEDISAYLDFLRRGAAPKQVVADMTPAYALLSIDRMQRMARMAADVRFLYVLRDPVDRLWSHIRMVAARRDANGRVTKARCDRILARFLHGGEPQIAERSDYASTISKLLAAVPDRRLLIEVFEDMIAGDAFARICVFLGIARVKPSRIPVHEGQPLDMTLEQRDAAAAWLAPQYDAAAQALGGMPEAWRRKG